MEASYPMEGHAHVLLVEQDSSMADALKAILHEEAGYDVVRVCTPVEAYETLHVALRVQRYAECPPDLIMFDVAAMDDHNRSALSEIIESRHNWRPTAMQPDLPVGNMEKTLLTVNDRAIIVRPFSLETVLDTVQEMMRIQGHALDTALDDDL